MMRCSRALCGTALALLLNAAFALAADKPTPPGQPKTGPGGAEYAHAEVTETVLGQGDTQAWLYEPAKPAPESAPVVVLLHGWGALDSRGYRAWINHLVRRGNIVIYPRYQAGILTPPETMTGNTVAAIKSALDELKKRGHVAPDEAKLAVVGHSLGAVIAVNLAAEGKRAGIPQPLAVMSIEPGDSKGSRTAQRFGREVKSVLTDYSTIPKGTLVLVVVGEEDYHVTDRTAKVIWDGVAHLPKEDRDFITVGSDRRGTPALVAGHFFPAAPESGVEIPGFSGVDALDYYAAWKLLDGLTDAAFYKKNRQYALGDTPEQRFMGNWSDGIPVKELKVLKK